MFNVRFKHYAADNVLQCVREQPGRELILDTNQRLRNEDLITKDRPGFGRYALNIPFEDYVALQAKYPELASNDPLVKSKAYHKFMQSPESLPYRVRERI